MTGCQCQVLLSLKQSQGLPNVTFKHLPNYYIANCWELIVGRAWFSGTYLYMSENSFLTSFFCKVCFCLFVLKGAIVYCCKGLYENYVQFSSLEQKRLWSQGTAMKLLTNNAWSTFLFLHKHNGNDMMAQFTGIFHGLLKNKYEA